ncbi:MAG: hypothetical protein ACRDRA_13970 [Pseudonocardiaceae bacterium]
MTAVDRNTSAVAPRAGELLTVLFGPEHIAASINLTYNWVCRLMQSATVSVAAVLVGGGPSGSAPGDLV